MEWVKLHWDTIWLAVTTAVTLASVVARLTPSDKDDAFFAKVVNFIALNKKS